MQDARKLTFHSIDDEMNYLNAVESVPWGDTWICFCIDVLLLRDIFFANLVFNWFILSKS